MPEEKCEEVIACTCELQHVVDTLDRITLIVEPLAIATAVNKTKVEFLSKLAWFNLGLLVAVVAAMAGIPL